MLLHISRRLLWAIPTLFAVSFVVFFLGYLAPGSPIDIIAGQHADPETKQRLTRAYGLDQPPLTQYGRYLSGAVKGDLGKSFANSQKPVSEIIGPQFSITATVACLALLMSILLGIPTGMIAALFHNRWPDRLTMFGVLLFVSMPSFVIAPILMLYLALNRGWLPVSGWEDWRYMVMPVLVLGSRPSALLARLMRSSMLEVLRQDYVRTAHAKGLAPTRVLMKHALKNAFLPVLTAIGNSFGFLLTGSFVVETIFSVPGIGFESVQSILRRDYPVIQGIALLVATIFILVNLVVDILYTMIDPRVRYEEAK
jgi:ABC-type dipeptide/oligopeptide/nickel transport system permease component